MIFVTNFYLKTIKVHIGIYRIPNISMDEYLQPSKRHNLYCENTSLLTVYGSYTIYNIVNATMAVINNVLKIYKQSQHEYMMEKGIDKYDTIQYIREILVANRIQFYYNNS